MFGLNIQICISLVQKQHGGTMKGGEQHECVTGEVLWLLAVSAGKKNRVETNLSHTSYGPNTQQR